LNKIFNILDDDLKDKLRKKSQPDWTKPMLATLTKERFSKKDWIYERKLDGERCLIFRKGKKVRMMSRNQKKINGHYPEIADVFINQKYDFIVDGEIVAFDGNVTSFSMLQPRMHSSKPDMSIEVFYYVFDIIYLEGYDVSKLPLRHRKALLKEAIDFDAKNLRYTTHRNKEGEKFLQEACKKGWEGLIAKDANSIYYRNRSKKWLKFICDKGQELVICGYTAPGGSRKHFGALIVGYYQDGELKHAGKVGTGYDEKTLKLVHEKMKKLEQADPPFDKEKTKYKNATWLKPKLVGEFRFTEWTGDNKLRHPSFLGLREDKKAKDVKKEEPKS
jgi:DNA ligase D-like protein (predicted ligase)